MKQDTRSTPDAAWLAAHVVKSGVMLGGLTDPQRRAALALVWAALPAADGFTEAALNAVLRAQLAGPAACLDTDHVELRRWLIDTGFVQRDGFGRRYAQTTLQQLPPPAQSAAERVLAAIADSAITAWVQTRREAHAARRAARRQAWAAAAPSVA